MRRGFPSRGRGDLPAHLHDVKVPILLAAKIGGRGEAPLYKAAAEGRLRATPFPSGKNNIHWQVSLADLADYIREPLNPEWLEIIEECLAWEPGQEVRRVA